MNITDYLNHQKAEDRRAFIIHFPPCSGKTQFARRLAETRLDVYYLDLLAFCLVHPELPPVAQFDFKALRALLLGLDVPQAVILVDHPDFLFNTWNAGEKRALLHWLQLELRSPADTEKTFVFIIQNDDVLAAAEFRNAYDEPRVLALNRFEAIKG